MADYILTHRREIDREFLSEMHRGDDAGTPTLEIRLHYHKDACRRGLKLAVYRCAVHERGATYDIMNRYNGRIHLADMARKPSPKAAEAWRQRVESRLDEIAGIVLASDAPDWSAVAALFTEESAT